MSAVGGQRPPAGASGPAEGPPEWLGAAHWRILQLGFGDGLRFLRTWRAWKDDPGRPALLHYVAVEGAACGPSSLHDGARDIPGLPALARLLAQQWFGLLPGFHRLAFEEGRVLLTLCVGETGALLRDLAFRADRVVLQGMQPTDRYRLKAIARLCRRGTRLEWSSAAAPSATELRQGGFVISSGARSGEDAAATRSAALTGAVFDPPWTEKRADAVATRPGRCVVVGAGVAGAAAAASLARRGWEVEVLDASDAPATGASSLPAGLLVPHQSPDDALLSRLSRAGVRITLNEAARLLREGRDWAPTGVLDHRPDIASALPGQPAHELAAWSRHATAGQKAEAGLAPHAAALWHERAAWIRPAALVHAWLAQPGVGWRKGVRVARIERAAQGWRLLDATGHEVACGDLVVVAAAHQSTTLLPIPLPLQPVRGQVSWSTDTTGQPLPRFPVSGDGHFVPAVPTGSGTAWLCGATFDRDDTDLAPRPHDHAANLARLARLLPSVGDQLAPVFAACNVMAWTGVRCASADRRPLVGEVAPGLWVSTAMGSRGLTFAHLCAELMAARLHAEPLPLPQKLAAALDPQRLRPAAAA